MPPCGWASRIFLTLIFLNLLLDTFQHCFYGSVALDYYNIILPICYSLLSAMSPLSSRDRILVESWNSDSVESTRSNPG